RLDPQRTRAGLPGPTNRMAAATDADSRRRCGVPAHGAAQPDRQCGEVHPHPRAGDHRDRCRATFERSDRLCTRQWRGLRYAICRQVVRCFSASASHGRVRGNRHRPGERAAHHRAPRWASLGGRRAGPGRYLLFLATETALYTSLFLTRQAMLKPILLVEDNPHDLELTLIALERSQLANEVVIMRDGAEALNYLQRTGDHAGRADGNPAVLLLDLKLPK